MPPKSLSLKKAQQGPPKNQKAITQFFKSTNVANTQSLSTKTQTCPEVEKASVKRKATSPLFNGSIETEKACSSNGIDINKKLKSERQPVVKKPPVKSFQNGVIKSPIKNGHSCDEVNKSPGKENGCKSSMIDLDFDSLLNNDHVEINGKNNDCSSKKNRSPLTPSKDSNIIEYEVQSIHDADECKSSETDHDSNIQCQAKFSPNFYDILDENSPVKKSPTKQSNSTSESQNSPKIVRSPQKKHSPDKCAKVLEFSDPEVDGMFGDDWAEDIDEDTLEDLDLTTIQRCEIEAVNKLPNLPNRLELKLKNTTNNRATCFVEGIWLHTPLVPGDIISILSPRDSSGRFIVSNSSGLIVLRPDRLVSSTSVVAGVFCQRKAVLQERWRGIDSANTAMTIGILVHELVQKALTQNIKSVDQLRKEAQKIIKESIQSLYDAGLSEEEAISNMHQYISPLAEFMQMYVSDKPPTNMGQKDKWCGNINKVLDIEENVCCPQLGLKGKIDATLEVTIHQRKGRETAIMPLELKSGRASASAEHRGQLVLYGMMLSLQRALDPARDVQRGLLLYLKERLDLREVSCGYPERRDLMMLRNQLVQYLADGPTATDPEQVGDIEEAAQLLQQGLPEPVNHHNACAKCPYLTVCSLHLWHTNGPTLSESHPLSKLKQEALGHLSAAHVDYFLRWAARLKLEEAAQAAAAPLRALWTDTAEIRSKRGTCAANLRLKSVEQLEDRYTHIFERQIIDGGKATGHKTKGPQEGDFSIVSIENRPWIAAGVVTVANEDEMQILLERDLSRRLSEDTAYHIDTYESYATTVQNLTNLGVLLEDSDRAHRLRRLIIDKEAPVFEKKLPRDVGRLGAKLMKSLNIQQQRAVLKVLAAKDYALLQGLPGTGKTQTISVLIQMLVALKQRVLVTAHTHSAVDTVLTRLPAALRVLRLGGRAGARAAPALAARCEHRLAAGCETPDQLRQLYDSMEVVGVTCLGAAHALLARTTFDVCIVDEATQVLQCTVLRPLFAANRFVLVGDPEQLPPVVRSRAARRLGMEESLFHCLMTEEATCTLQLQYRMNQALADLANKVAYSDRLKCADEKVAQAKLDINTQKLSAHTSEAWLLKACSAEHAALFLDTKLMDRTETSVKSCANTDEACVVVALVEALMAGGVKSSDIGVISPFREQVALLRRALSAEVSTVDQFQGRDKPVIVYSCTKHVATDRRVKEGEVLNDQRRLAVGVTRAKHKFLIVGNSTALQRYAPLKRLIEVCPSLTMDKEDINRVVGKYRSVVS